MSDLKDLKKRIEAIRQLSKDLDIVNMCMESIKKIDPNLRCLNKDSVPFGTFTPSNNDSKMPMGRNYSKNYI